MASTAEKHPILIVPATIDTLNGKEQNVFGGWIMAQMDIAGSIIAIKKSRGSVVTRAVVNLEFVSPAFLGDLINIYAEVSKIGNTSITVKLEVIAERNVKDPKLIQISTADMVFVAVDNFGNPRRIKINI